MAKTNHSLIRSTALVSSCTGLSRILGLVREIFMAVLFGTTLAKSAFDIAFLIPNLFRRLFGEGALSAAFVPVFSETIEKRGKEDANALAGRVMTMLGVTLLSIVVAGVVLISIALHWLPLGERTAAVLPLLRIMLPYMFFICMVALCMAILNSLHHFLVPAFSPVLLNVIWILALMFVCPHMGETPRQRIFGAAWAVLAAGCIQLLVQIPVLRWHRIQPPVSFDWRDPAVRRVLLLMGPAAVGMGLFQVNTVIDRLLALLIAQWGPAALGYAERLIYLPLGVFATALGTVLLPTFSRQIARDENDDMKTTLAASMRGVMFVMLPAAVGLAVLAHPIVRLFFEWSGGEFNEESTVLTARAVLFYAPGLAVFSLYKVLVPAFYAMKDTKTPVKVGVCVILLNFCLNILFIITWPAGYKHAGLAFATVLSSAVSCGVLGWMLHRRIGSPGWSVILASWGKALVVSLAMGLIIVVVREPLGVQIQHFISVPKMAQIAEVVGLLFVGLMSYGVLGAILCRSEWRILRRTHRG